MEKVFPFYSSYVPSLQSSQPQCTKTVHKTINPSWNSTLHFSGVGGGHIANRNIAIAVLDEDLAGDQPLAEVLVSLKKVLSQNVKKLQLPLERPSDSGLIVAAHVGRVELALAFYAKSGSLKVTIIQCLDLPHVDRQPANPLVQVALSKPGVGGKHSSKNQTTVKWRSANPDFHEQFVYSSSASDLVKQSLVVTVWHRPPKEDKSKKAPKDVYVGGVILGGSGAKGGRLQHWSDLVKQPSTTHKRIHFLSANHVD